MKSTTSPLCTMVVLQYIATRSTGMSTVKKLKAKFNIDTSNASQRSRMTKITTALYKKGFITNLNADGIKMESQGSKIFAITVAGKEALIEWEKELAVHEVLEKAEAKTKAIVASAAKKKAVVKSKEAAKKAAIAATIKSFKKPKAKKAKTPSKKAAKTIKKHATFKKSNKSVKSEKLHAKL